MCVRQTVGAQGVLFQFDFGVQIFCVGIDNFILFFWFLFFLFYYIFIIYYIMYTCNFILEH